VDAKCRKLTAPWVRERAAAVPDIELCGFYEVHDKAGNDALLPPGVYTLQDLRQFGRKKGFCPYFLARRMIVHANVIVYNYQYMLDPKVSQMVCAHRLPWMCLLVGLPHGHELSELGKHLTHMSQRKATCGTSEQAMGLVAVQLGGCSRQGHIFAVVNDMLILCSHVYFIADRLSEAPTGDSNN
jgi:DNA excision repair protein ERCC-2